MRLRHHAPASLLALFVAVTIQAAPATQPNGADALPAEIRALKGKVVLIYYDVDVLGDGRSTPAQTLYLRTLLRDAGAVPETGFSSQKKPDLIILGVIDDVATMPKVANDSLACSRLNTTQLLKIEQYAELRPKLIQQAAESKTPVIESSNLRKSLGLRVTRAQMLEFLNQRASAVLQRRVPEANFKEVGFADVIDFLREVSGASIYVRWRALDAVGVDGNTSISIKEEVKSVGELLDIVLGKASGKNFKLAYEIREGVIEISTVEDLKNKKP